MSIRMTLKLRHFPSSIPCAVLISHRHSYNLTLPICASNHQTRLLSTSSSSLSDSSMATPQIPESQPTSQILSSLHDRQQQQWKLTPTGEGLEKSFKFKNFKVAWAFMNKVAEKADEMDHHPEWSNVSWSQLSSTLIIFCDVDWNPPSRFISMWV